MNTADERPAAMPFGELRDRLFYEILMARQRVYHVGHATPLERVQVTGQHDVYLKREDLSPVNSYKWRGAYNRMAQLTEAERARGVVAASAGNHAQGVALAARALGLSARIYMPVSTPRMKQTAVARHGGSHVDVVLTGDTYDAAAEAAHAHAAESDAVFIHPYNDLGVMGGQGTLADEVVMSGADAFDVAYLQIGGGGMAAAVACWLKAYYPGIRIVGVEGVEQASMAAAVRAGHPVALDYVDVFCDGTAVKRVGSLTHALCAGLIDEFVTVSNEAVCAAVQALWESNRCVPEPSGAMGLAGLLKHAPNAPHTRALCIVCGANMDFGQLAWIVQHAGIGAARRRYFRFEIDERRGTLYDLLENVLEGINIIEFQYGKVHPDRAYPVIGFEASPPELDLLDRRLREYGVSHEDVTSEEDVEFHMVHYDSSLFEHPYFIKLEFPERAGALRDFLDAVQHSASICYFNYRFSGEQVGRALLGFEFESEDARAQFRELLDLSGLSYREISEGVLRRVL